MRLQLKASMENNKPVLVRLHLDRQPQQSLSVQALLAVEENLAGQTPDESCSHGSRGPARQAKTVED